MKNTNNKQVGKGASTPPDNKTNNTPTNEEREEITIEKGIPVPQRSGRDIYGKILRAMEIGDSFFVPKDTKQISVSVGHWKKKLERSFVVRTEVQNKDGKEIKGSRVWRVEEKEAA